MKLVTSLIFASMLSCGIHSASAATTSTNIDITVTSGALSDEEFVGPFPSWMCAASLASGKCGAAAAQYCNADSTGASDASAATQSCINSLSSSKPVIYFPCGTYNISTTLTISNQQSIMLVGQDNSTAGGRCTTTLKWTGSSGGKLIYINGIVYSQLSRLTFDGNNLANILIDQSWDGSTGPFDASNQYIDDVFKNGNDTTTSYGYRCGYLGQGCSETAVIRGTFANLGFGVATCNANALDIWVWYSSFSNMRIAVTNNTSHDIGGNCHGGTFQVAGSNFNNSSEVDFYDSHAGASSIIDNYSSGSNQFSSSGGHFTFQRNTILNTNLANPSIFSNANWAVLLDNKIENTNTTSPYVSIARALSIGNGFTNTSPFHQQGGGFYQYGDQTIAYAPPGAPTLPGTPPNNNRTVYETSPGGSGTTCSASSPCSVQTAICLAATGSSGFSGGNCTGTVNSNKSVVHIPAGTYTISAILSIPANSNIQVIGDGWQTFLSGSVNPVMTVNGPSQIVLRGFYAHGGGSNDGIRISGVDQIGAYAYLRGLRLGGTTAGLSLNNLTTILVNSNNYQAITGSSPSVAQTGSGRYNQFFGTSGARSFSGSGSSQAIGSWSESSSFSTISTVSGTGTFIYSTALLQFPATFDAFDLSNFTGTFAVLNGSIVPTCPFTGYVVNATGSGAGGLIIAGLDFVNTTTPISNTAGSTVKFFGNVQGQCFADAGMADSPNPITSGDLAVVASGLQYFRDTSPMLPNGNPPGVSALELYDVFVDGIVTGIQISP